MATVQQLTPATGPDVLCNIDDVKPVRCSGCNFTVTAYRVWHSRMRPRLFVAYHAYEKTECKASRVVIPE